MHVNVPIILVVIGTFIVVLALVVVGRQLVVSRPRGGFACSVWRRNLLGHVGWQQGLMRFGTDRLRWYRAFSLWPAPEVMIRRTEVVDLQRRTVPTQIEGMDPQTHMILGTSGGRSIRLVADSGSASAIIAWLEAAPIGSGRHGDAD